jgi:predicted nuclease with TOPRIM domain
MINELIEEIEAKIRSATMSESGKNELLQSVAKLRAEAVMLETDREKLKSLKSPVEELRSSVEGFEQSHPKLIQAVNSISSTLSNWGV